MATVTSSTPATPTRTRRTWKAPRSRFAWVWLAFALVLCTTLYLLYADVKKFSIFNPSKGGLQDPFYVGLIAYILIMSTAAYSLRRRFVRGLPGKVQNWLWAHTWLGIGALILVFLHDRYLGVLSNYCPNLGCLSGPSLIRFKPGPPSFGYAALYAMVLLIVSGVTGRLIDVWQTHTIARDASANNIGITSALKERILELEYTVERLSAGKSEPFKQYCLQGLDHPGVLHGATPTLLLEEQADFQRAQETLTTYDSLSQSLRRQQRASRIMRIWRSIHMTIVPFALVVITYHAGTELLVNIFHIIKLH